MNIIQSMRQTLTDRRFPCGGCGTEMSATGLLTTVRMSKISRIYRKLISIMFFIFCYSMKSPGTHGTDLTTSVFDDVYCPNEAVFSDSDGNSNTMRCEGDTATSSGYF